MNNLSANKIKKIEFYSIFLNNIFLLLGILFFGWTLFETLFLYWLELLAAIILLFYIQIVCPLKYGRPGQIHLTAYRKTAAKTLFLTFYTLMMHYQVLLYLIDVGTMSGWDTSHGFIHTLVQLPLQLWEGNLLVLTVLFLLVYLLPSLLNEKKGLRPTLDNLPMQSKIMTHKSQFVVSYILFAILWCMSEYFAVKEAIVLISVLLILKSVYEIVLFKRLE
jgi:hypothetical protein